MIHVIDDVRQRALGDPDALDAWGSRTGRRMHYRLYLLDPRTGAIILGEDLTADDDAAALARCAELLERRKGGFELWCGVRRVYCTPTPDQSAA